MCPTSPPAADSQSAAMCFSPPLSAAIGTSAFVAAALLAKRGRPLRCYCLFLYFGLMECECGGMNAAASAAMVGQNCSFWSHCSNARSPSGAALPVIALLLRVTSLQSSNWPSMQWRISAATR